MLNELCPFCKAAIDKPYYMDKETHSSTARPYKPENHLKFHECPTHCGGYAIDDLSSARLEKYPPEAQRAMGETIKKAQMGCGYFVLITYIPDSNGSSNRSMEFRSEKFE